MPLLSFSKNDNTPWYYGETIFKLRPFEFLAAYNGIIEAVWMEPDGVIVAINAPLVLIHFIYMLPLYVSRNLNLLSFRRLFNAVWSLFAET